MAAKPVEHSQKEVKHDSDSVEHHKKMIMPKRFFFFFLEVKLLELYPFVLGQSQ